MTNTEADQRIHELRHKAAEARRLIVEALIGAGCGHAGGALSCIDILIALYFEILRVDPKNPNWADRDRFVLSKGHASVALYTTLCLRGFISQETLMTHRKDGSILSGHPDMRKVPGVEMSTGSMGHGMPAAVGMALAAKMDRKGTRVFAVLGDGETQEGSIWEAAMCASHYRLDNFTAIVDRNRIQIDGFTEDIMGLEPYAAKWRAFGWEVTEIDGHDMAAVVTTLRGCPFQAGRPSLVLANTVKGKGISFMENKSEWHGKPLKGEEAAIARREVEQALAGA